MRKTVLYIAMSLDGFIADERGGVDWLTGQEETDSGDSYSKFVQTVDTVVMGWNTYHQIVTKLSPETWVYQGLQSYVITHRACEEREEIAFTDKMPGDLIRELKAREGKDIWICGGADVVRQLVREDLIDRYHISLIPTLLGRGIRLFDGGDKEIRLKLLETGSCNGIAELIYVR